MFAVREAGLFCLRHCWKPVPLQEVSLLAASNNYGGPGSSDPSPMEGGGVSTGAGMVAIHKAHSGFPSGGRSGQGDRGRVRRKTLQPPAN